MEDDTVLACGKIGVKLSGEPAEDLKLLKTIVLILKKSEMKEGTHFYAVEMRKAIFTKEKFPRLIRRKMKKTEYRRSKPPRKVRKLLKECRILAEDGDRVLFLASREITMALLSFKGMQLKDVPVDEILGYLAKGEPESGQKE